MIQNLMPTLKNYVSSSGPSHSPSASGKVEFCVRLLAYLESIKAGFHESRFRFTFNMSTDFDLVDVGIKVTGIAMISD